MFLSWLALAEVPESVRPIAAPSYAADDYGHWAASRRKDELLCDKVVADILVCFQVDQQERRRWVGTADLGDWKVTRAEFLATMRRRAEAAVTVVKQESDGVAYWIHEGETRWSAGTLLRPDLVSKALDRSAFHLVVPLEHTVLFWPEGGTEQDQIMGVGAVEMTERQAGAVSGTILRWSQGGFSIYAQAVAEEPRAPAPSKATP